jgi:hypothetical protein
MGYNAPKLVVSVFCAVRAVKRYLYCILNCQDLAGFSLRMTGFDPRSIRVIFVEDNVATGQVFLVLSFFFSPVISVFPCRNVFANDPVSDSDTSCSYRKDERAKAGNFSKSNFISANEERWIETYFYTYIITLLHTV